MTDVIKIMSIDPGLSTAGWVYSEYHQEDQSLHVKDFGIIQGTRYADLKAQQELVELYGRRCITLSEIRTKIVELYQKYHPDYVESENAFFNRFRPAAFVALNDFICTVRSTLHKEFEVPLYLISPKSIKKVVCTGDANKDDVQTAVQKNKHIFIESENIPDAEHEWDAIGGAYAFVKLYLEHVRSGLPYDEVICSQKQKPIKKKS